MSRHLAKTRCLSPALPIAVLETGLLAKIGKGVQAPGDPRKAPPPAFRGPFRKH